MNRREFLKVSSLAAAAAALDGCRSFGGSGFAVNGIKVGVQMWSVNDLWKKENATYETVKTERFEETKRAAEILGINANPNPAVTAKPMTEPMVLIQYLPNPAK